MFTLPKTYAAKKRYWARRRRIMLDLVAEGWTLERIGKKYGIKRQAVWRVIQEKTR